MSKIEMVRVGDVLHLERRPVVVDPFSVYREIGVRSFGRGLFHKEPISGSDLGAKRVFSLCAGDLVLSNVFAWEGAIAVASDKEDGCIGSHRFMTYVPRDDRTDSDYLRYFFLSDRGLELIRRASPGSAGRNRTLGIDAFESLEIPLPSRQAQELVASRIASASTRIADIKGRAARARTLSDAVVGSILGDSHKLTPSRRGDLVEEARLGDVLELVRRPVVVDAFASYTQIGVRSFGKGIFHYEPTSGADLGKLRYFEIHPGELVISNIKGWEGAVAVSSAADEGCIGSNRFLTYVARDDLVDVNYLRYVLLTERGLELLRRASPGSTDRNLTLGIAAFESLRVRLPDRDVQTKVAARLDRIVALRARTQSQLDLLDGFASSLVDAQLTLIGV